MDDIVNHFPAKNALECRILHIYMYSLEIFPGVIPPPGSSQKRPPVLGHRHQFPLGSPAFPLLLFYETATVPRRSILVISPPTSSPLPFPSVPPMSCRTALVTVRIMASLFQQLDTQHKKKRRNKQLEMLRIHT